MGNFISCFQEKFHLSIVAGVLVQILLSNGERLELFDGVVVVSNLGEGERLLVNFRSVHVNWEFTKSLFLRFLLNLESLFKMFSVKGHAKVFKEFVNLCLVFLRDLSLFGLLSFL